MRQIISQIRLGIGGKVKFLQVIFNSKTIYPSNAKRMIEKSDIPLAVWLKKCK